MRFYGNAEQFKNHTPVTLVERNLKEWPDMSDGESTEMLSFGPSPWYGRIINPNPNVPEGVWCWDSAADQVLIGTCPDDAVIVSYDAAREVFADFLI